MFKQILEDNRKFTEALWQKLEDSNKKIRLWNDEINNDEQTKDKEETSTLLSENKHHRNEENIQHKEAIIKSVKNQVIQKIKKIGKIFPKKKMCIRDRGKGIHLA